jgi:hypothetical protein
MSLKYSSTTAPTRQALAAFFSACLPLSPTDSSFPIWNSTHPGGSLPREPLKTITDKIPTRHTPMNCDVRRRRKSQSSHPDIKLAPKPLKTFTKKNFNRHTFAYVRSTRIFVGRGFNPTERSTESIPYLLPGRAPRSPVRGAWESCPSAQGLVCSGVSQ